MDAHPAVAHHQDARRICASLPTPRKRTLDRAAHVMSDQETGELDYFQLKTTVFNGNEKVLHELFDAGILLYRSVPLSVWPTSNT